MSNESARIREEFAEALSHVSRFWGFPKGVGRLFAVLYLSSTPLSLDQLVEQSGLTKGAVSTNVRALARMGLVHLCSRPGDRKDYYAAETDFYRAIRSILNERQNAEFSHALQAVRQTLDELRAERASLDTAERKFLIERVQALQDFFDAIDSLSRAVMRLDKLGITNVQKVLSVLK